MEESLEAEALVTCREDIRSSQLSIASRNVSICNLIGLIKGPLRH
jgi:hypothetical protein